MSTIGYLTTVRTIAVDMIKLAGGARPRWYDPSDGTYCDARDVTLVNVGRQGFTPPGKNRADDRAWVLVLDPQ